jgi:hypothetical protein
VNTLTEPKSSSPKLATGQPGCKSSRSASPHFRISAVKSDVCAGAGGDFGGLQNAETFRKKGNSGYLRALRCVQVLPD